ncbi:hypothetical protein HOC35_01955 [Candidatus Woesearchaeota archaeon]|jgi:hypothetical protein|nr:hypothetical protein [Candidatus Woesearchaeota archaeon]
MKESVILKTAFIISVLGIMLLYVFSETLTLEETKLNETIENGKLIKVKGIVKNINVKNKLDENNNKENNTKTYTILTIEQTNTIAVYAADEINVIEGARVEISGKIEGDMMFADEIKID